jgi:hypothetical protein
MVRTAAFALVIVILAAALGTWLRSSSDHTKSTVPAEASSTPMLPIELMRKSNKDLPDQTPREPF